MSADPYFLGLEADEHETAYRADTLGIDDVDACPRCDRLSVPVEGCVGCGDEERREGRTINEEDR